MLRSGVTAATSASDSSSAFTAIAPGTMTLESIMITDPPAAVTFSSQTAVASVIMVVTGTITARYRSGDVTVSASSSIRS